MANVRKRLARCSGAALALASLLFARDLRADEKVDLSGVWKITCDTFWGLEIARVNPNEYSISFCGTGGCGPPGVWAPNSPIVGDSAWQVISSTELKRPRRDGQIVDWHRCEIPPGQPRWPPSSTITNSQGGERQLPAVYGWISHPPEGSQRCSGRGESGVAPTVYIRGEQEVRVATTSGNGLRIFFDYEAELVGGSDATGTFGIELSDLNTGRKLRLSGSQLKGSTFIEDRDNTWRDTVYIDIPASASMKVALGENSHTGQKYLLSPSIKFVDISCRS
jgi:hypothetical protein